jgi:cysteinyl-tRNA synthetase
MRAYIFTDTLRRVLERDGYNVFQVMNITDVGHLVSDADEGEDKVVKAAQSTGKTPLEITECYTEAFFHDTRLLNIRTPNLIAKATEHIADMLECIEKLVDLGYGYETSDGIYYDISKFPDYGKLSRLDLEGQIAGARVEVNEEKRNPADFILWVKAPKEHIMQWPSKWGMGYPGWHIECTAMSRKYLGEIMDIHTGGVDHIPVHHENEIAQSEALSGGKKTVNYWMHNEFIMVDNGKMSKSLGTSYTLADFIERGFDPLVFRYFCLNGHYKSKLNFTWDGMKAVRTSYERFLETALSHSGQTGIVDAETLETLKSEFYEAVGDDLNIPKALGVAWNMLRLPVKSGEIFEAIVEMDAILGLDISRAADKLAEMNRANAPETDAEILGLVEQRQQARKEKNWKLADEIRDKLKQMNIILEDTPEGIKYRKADNI